MFFGTPPFSFAGPAELGSEVGPERVTPHFTEMNMKQKPEILVTTLDAERLEILLDSLSPTAFPIKSELEEELERAVHVAPQNIPPDVVTMNSTVRFELQPSGEEHCLKLVYPGGHNDEGGSISILAPVGSALLGLSEGNGISWPRPDGRNLYLVVKEVVDQPERSGNYDL